MSLTGNEWQKHPIVTGLVAPCILGIDYLRRGYFKELFSSGRQSVKGTGRDVFYHLYTLPFSFTLLFSSRLVTIALQDFEYPWDVQTSMLLLLCLLNVLQVLFKVNQLLRNAIQRSVLRQDSYECQDKWEDMGRHLEQWAPPVLWTFTPEPVSYTHLTLPTILLV